MRSPPKVVKKVNKKKRFCNGFFASLFLHIIAVIFFGLFGIFTLPNPKDLVFDVVFVGGGGGGGSGGQNAVVTSENEQSQDAKEQIKPDDIIEKRMQQEKKTVEKPPDKIDKKETAQKNDSPNTATGQGSGTGSGIGTGSGSGEGSGQDSGKGSGIGEGTGSGSGSGEGIPVTQPVLLNYRDPEYPFAAMRDGIEGSAVVQVLVTADGRAQNPVLARSSGRKDFDASALQSARGWRFSPSKDNRGVSVPCTVTIQVNFKLRNR